MNVPASACALLAIAPVAAAAAEIVPVPTTLEAFASESNSHVVASATIGSIDSLDATLTVVAVTVADDRGKHGVMSGHRFDLRNNTAMDSVYLDGAQLASLKKDLAEIEHGIPRLEKGRNAPYRTQGTASCWVPDPPIRILCPSHRVGPDWSGLTLGAFGGPVFDFPGRKPSDLLRLLADRPLLIDESR